MEEKMISEYSRKQFSQDTSYTVVIDKKFKTNSWKIKFIASLDEVNSPALSLAASVLSSCNSEEKTMPMEQIFFHLFQNVAICLL